MSKIQLDRFVEVFNNDILPLTFKGVDFGNKIFGAAILKKEDYSLVDQMIRPNEKNCIFLSSHEPCSLCLSAITFSGFDNFYYLFPYEATSDEFNIPHDLNILKEIFNISNGKYIKENSYWKSYNINKLIEKLPDEKKHYLTNSFDEIKKKYISLSKKYQRSKEKNSIPLK